MDHGLLPELILVVGYYVLDGGSDRGEVKERTESLLVWETACRAGAREPRGSRLVRLVACRHSSAIFFPPSWPLTVSARSPLSLPTMSLYEAPSSRPQSTAISTTDTLPAPTASQEKVKATPSVPSRDFGFLPIPNRVRYDPDHPAHFGLLMNATFGIASTFSTSYLQHLFIPSSTLAVVANLYYCQPLLSEFSFYSWGSRNYSSTLVSVNAVPMKLTLAKHSSILLGLWSDLSRGVEHTHTRASWVSDNKSRIC